MKKNPKNLEIRCPRCSKVTNHYLASNGEYRCMICGNVGKKVTPKKELEVVFEADKELDSKLNPEEEVPQVDNTVI